MLSIVPSLFPTLFPPSSNFLCVSSSSERPVGKTEEQLRNNLDFYVIFLKVCLGFGVAWPRRSNPTDQLSIFCFNKICFGGCLGGIFLVFGVFSRYLESILEGFLGVKHLDTCDI